MVSLCYNGVWHDVVRRTTSAAQPSASTMQRTSGTQATGGVTGVSDQSRAGQSAGTLAVVLGALFGISLVALVVVLAVSVLLWVVMKRTKPAGGTNHNVPL